MAQTENNPKTELFLKRYDYNIPKILIATEPVTPRENAKLLVYNRASGKTEFGHFYDLPKCLGPETVLVFNETKVVPARLTGETPMGGRVLMTVVKILDGEVTALLPRRLKAGTLISIGGKRWRVIGRSDRFTRLETHASSEETRGLLEKEGRAPLPPYIKHTPLSVKEARERYQTVFAKNEGSIAAPTASLHFGKKLIAELKARGVGTEFVTLHVGLGTFLPVSASALNGGRLHEEEYFIGPETAERINGARREGKKIIPVGTTTLRTLESAADASSKLTKLSGVTDLFIRPGYQFKFRDGLITNFHIPRSSLLMLIDAFLEDQSRWRRIYTEAIARKFRLFSFGDGMFIV